MLTSAQIEKTGLFFALTLLNQKQSVAAAGNVIASFKADDFLQRGSETIDSALIAKCKTVLAKFRRNDLASDIGAGFLVKSIDLGPWIRFRKEAEEEEVIAVILRHILDFPIADISNGLGVTPGTLQYRLARGVLKLGLLAKVQ